MSNLEQGRHWLNKQFNPIQAIYNAALHECIAMGNCAGVIRALDNGANPRSIVRLGEEREGLTALERCTRSGDNELIELIKSQFEA